MSKKAPWTASVLALLGVVMSLTGCAADPAEAEEPTVLFSVTSERIHFENRAAETVTLVMEGVDEHAIWFTDRPVRESGVITTSHLAASWGPGKTFTEDPPNAALVLHEPVTTDAGVTDTMVVEILTVAYDAAQRTLRADLRVLDDEEADALDGNLAGHGDRSDTAWPDEADAASLFIDSCSTCIIY